MSKDKRVSTAEKYLADGKLDKALKLYQKIAEEDPSDMRLRLKLADIYLQKRDLSHAVECYQAVAEAYVLEQFQLKAVAIYKKILSVNPTLTIFNEKLGDLYREMGLQKDALNQYQIVANHYEQIGDSEKVLEVRRKIVETDPSSVTQRIRLAETFQQIGSTEDTLREYERVAHELEQSGNRDALAEAYEKLLYYDPEQTERLVTLTKIYLDKGDAERALKRIEAAGPGVQDDAAVQEVLTDIYMSLGQRENARRLLQKLYEHCGETKDRVRAQRVYQRIQKEFQGDEEYLLEIEKVRHKKGLVDEGPPVAGRQDEFDRTIVGRPEDLAPTGEPKVPAREVPYDADKTDIVDTRALDETEKEKK